MNGDARDAARRLPRRFFERVEVSARDDGFAILLDARPLRTPWKNSFVVPTAALAEAVAAEWRAQKTRIDPAAMPLTGLANAAIDKAAGAERGGLNAHVRELAEHDLLCYRAGAEQPRLGERQRREWDPLIDWARTALGAELHTAQGVMPLAQPAAAVTALSAPYEEAPAFPFIALFAMATLTRSAILPLAVARARLSPEEAWAAATLEERWNMALWGEDAEAAANLAERRAQFLAAAQFHSLCGGK